MGEEFRAKGRHIALGPMMNLMRIPAAGRNWEGCALSILNIRDTHLSVDSEPIPSSRVKQRSRRSLGSNRREFKVRVSLSG